MNSQTIKEKMYSLGADLCGVASIDRFADAPKGFHPRDVLPGCQSVISFACRFPVGTLSCLTPTPYTRVRNSITERMDSLALELCIWLDRQQILAVPVPTNESEWDGNTGRMRSIISQKHAAQAAGLGTIGRHSLLITPELGSMVWLGAVITTAELEPDELKPPICIGCKRCVAACPVHALDGAELAQQTCWDYAFGDIEERKTWAISCHRCRDACPNNLGSMNKDVC